MAAIKRKEGEDYEVYRLRRYAHGKLLKQYLRGKMVWQGGTYEKPKGLPKWEGR